MKNLFNLFRLRPLVFLKIANPSSLYSPILLGLYSLPVKLNIKIPENSYRNIYIYIMYIFIYNIYICIYILIYIYIYIYIYYRYIQIYIYINIYIYIYPHINIDFLIKLHALRGFITSAFLGFLWNFQENLIMKHLTQQK